MSLDQPYKRAMQVWGSSTYRILLEIENKRLKNEFFGKITLFEHRHETSSSNFNTLEQFVSQTRKMWKESLRAASVQDTRLARWIEEYFSELGLKASYNDILDAVRGKFEEVPPLEFSDEKLLDQDEVNDIFPEVEDIMVTGTIRKLEGDLSDKEEVERILDKFITENKPERKVEAKSKTTFTTPDGEEKVIEETNEIEDSPLEDEVKLESGFSNNFDFPISDIELSDVVPYDYEIIDVQILGEGINRTGQKKTEDGLKVNWKIDKLDPGEKAVMEYDLGKRMLRTILIRDDFDLTILQTYENIHKDQNSAWVECTYTFHEKSPVVENVKILDQIPGEYQLVDSKPDAVPPLAQVTIGNQATEISWSYTEVPAHTQFVVTYDLDTIPKLLRNSIHIIDDESNEIADIVRIMKPMKGEDSIGVIFGVHVSDEFPKKFEIIDQFPSSFEISQIKIESGDIAELSEDGNKTLIWKLENIPIGKTICAYFKYIGTESYKFDKFKIKVEDKQLEEEHISKNLLKNEKISLPEEIL